MHLRTDQITFDTSNADSKYLTERTISDKILRDRAYENTINPEYDGYEKGNQKLCCKVFYTKTASKMGIIVNQINY